MLRDGWEIDAHTLTHPDLTTVDAARLRREVAGSRRWLRHAFGVPVDFFAYPSGSYNPAVEAAVRAAGYMGATTTAAGRGHARGRSLRAAAGPRHAGDDPGAAGGDRARTRPPVRPTPPDALRRARAAAQLAAPPAHGRGRGRRRPAAGGAGPGPARGAPGPARAHAGARRRPTSTRRSPTSARWSSRGSCAARCTSWAATTTRGCWRSRRPRACRRVAGGWRRRAWRPTTPSAR